MSRKVMVGALSALVLSAQMACVTKNVSAKCTVNGAEYLSADASAGQICRTFEERLAQALTSGDETAGNNGLTIAIELHKRGSAEARVIRQTYDGPIEYPTVSVDVMDRPLVQKDLDRLADAVAQLLMEKQAEA